MKLFRKKQPDFIEQLAAINRIISPSPETETINRRAVKILPPEQPIYDWQTENPNQDSQDKIAPIIGRIGTNMSTAIDNQIQNIPKDAEPTTIQGLSYINDDAVINKLQHIE